MKSSQSRLSSSTTRKKIGLSLPCKAIADERGYVGILNGSDTFLANKQLLLTMMKEK